MKYNLFLLLTLCLCCCSPNKQSSREIEKVLCHEITEDLKNNILPFWEQYSPDPRGGFYGVLENDGKPVETADKGGVLNARILWTFSTAYYKLNNDSYKKLADQAQEYFLSNFIDPEYGGIYWSLKYDGKPSDTQKQTYGIAYGIYALAAHYRATGNKTSLDAAVSQYETLEKHAFDPEHGGYIESFTRDWSKPEKYGYDGKGIAAKTMNTHLHVLEAYSALYHVWPDPGLEKQLRSLIQVFIEKIIDQERWHEKLFLTMDWENLEDIDSYGHDMELAWLLSEAAENLKDEKLIKETGHIALQLVDTQMKEGWNEDGSLLYERVDGVVKGGLEWWPQAESVVAFINAWQISGDQKYLNAGVKTWEWIKKYLVDYEYGEWYSGVNSSLEPDKRRPKASLWRCPYHNSRMGFELMTRICIFDK